jgi:hypothetical protein
VSWANCEPIEYPFKGYWLDGRPILPLRIRWAANYINCDNFPSEIPKISRINCKVPTPAGQPDYYRIAESDRRWNPFCMTWTERPRSAKIYHSPAPRRHPALQQPSQAFTQQSGPYSPFWPIDLSKVFGLAEKGERRQ